MIRNLKFAIAFAVAAAVGGGVAHAAIPSTGTRQITACYSQANPALKVIDTDAGQKCAAGETTLSWNQGWQFRGEYSGVPNYRKGDVVRISRKYNTGCTTPQGTWLALVDGASPCTERPESWATLALDAPKGPDVHWMRLNHDGSVGLSSEPVTSGPIWLYGVRDNYYRFATITSHSNCAVTVTEHPGHPGPQRVVTFAATWPGTPGHVVIGARYADTGYDAEVALDVTVICGTYQ